jgi:hypothetical protein
MITKLGTLAPLADPTFTGTVSGITKTMVGLGNVDNTSDLNKPLSTATTNALALKQDGINGSNRLTALYVGNGTVNNTKFAFLANCTADIQTQLNTITSTKAPLASPAFTGTPDFSGATSITGLSLFKTIYCAGYVGNNGTAFVKSTSGVTTYTASYVSTGIVTITLGTGYPGGGIVYTIMTGVSNTADTEMNLINVSHPSITNTSFKVITMNINTSTGAWTNTNRNFWFLIPY